MKIKVEKVGKKVEKERYKLSRNRERFRWEKFELKPLENQGTS